MALTRYERTKLWRQRHPEQRRAQARAEAKRRRARDPERVRLIALKSRYKNLERTRMQSREYQRKQRANPEAQRRRMAQYKARQEALLVAVAGRPRCDHCELCLRPAKTVFDHCHSTGQFRGWLCQRCNRTLGQVKDDPALLLKMIRYIEYGHTLSGRSAEAPQIAICDPLSLTKVRVVSDP